MLQDMLKYNVSSMKSPSADDLLAALGLARHRSLVAIVGLHAAILATGMVLGAGIALLTAPKSGRALRQEIKTKASAYTDLIGKKVGEATSELRRGPSLEDGIKQKGLQQQGNGEESAHHRT